MFSIFPVIYIFGRFGRFVSVVSFRSFRFGRFGGFGRFVSVVSFRFDVSPFSTCHENKLALPINLLQSLKLRSHVILLFENIGSS